VAQGTSSLAKQPKEALITDRKRHKVEASLKVERNPDGPATVADIEVDENLEERASSSKTRDVSLGS
jgi:hypothetical protein